MNNLGHVFKMLDKKGNFLEVDFRKESPKDVDKYTNLGGWTYHEVFERKDYETEKCFIQKGDVVVDVGANLGFFTVYAYLKGASKIYSFEPDVKNFECLKQNSPPCAEVFNYGIMVDPGEHVFFVDVNPGGHSFFNFGDTRTGEKRTVRCLSIPSLFQDKGLEKIDFLKIDAEGAEVEILMSLQGRYFHRIRNIAFEYHNMMFKENTLALLLGRLNEWYNWTFKTTGFLSLINLWKRKDKMNLPS
jgi:FkbM family methyltransferase